MADPKILRAIDLFAGCGGLSSGLGAAGFRVVGAVEVDLKARETYSSNHPNVPLIGSDIRGVGARDLLRACNLRVGELDLMAGCPPCQGFSTLRVRNRPMVAADPRNTLIDDFARLVLAVLPKMVMMENVPALARYDKFQDFVKRLEAANYQVDTRIFDVSSFNVPQRRKRLILSASRVGAPMLGSVSSARRSVRDAIAGLGPAGSSGDHLHDMPSPLRTDRVQALISAIPKNGGSRCDLPAEMELACHKRTNGFNDVYGRMAWDDVSPTITSGCVNPSKGRFIHPEENRPITLREASLLQGFPPDYHFNVRHGKEAIALMIGNALPPPFIAAHAAVMAAELRK